MGHRANAASRYTAGGCATATRFADVEPGLKAVDGSDPPLAMPSAGIAEGWDVHIPDTLPGGSLPIQQSRAGRPTSTRDGLVSVLLGDAERPDGQPVGDRVLRRLEAALEPPSRAGIT